MSATNGNGHVRNPGGKPTRMNADVVEKILQGIRAGVRMDTVGPFAGIGSSTFFDWLKEGRSPTGRARFREFAAQVDEALATWEATQILQIAKAGEKEWQARAWLLERRMPEHYGRRTQHEHTGQIEMLTVDAVDAEIARLAAELNAEAETPA